LEIINHFSTGGIKAKTLLPLRSPVKLIKKGVKIIANRKRFQRESKEIIFKGKNRENRRNYRIIRENFIKGQSSIPGTLYENEVRKYRENFLRQSLKKLPSTSSKVILHGYRTYPMYSEIMAEKTGKSTFQDSSRLFLLRM